MESLSQTPSISIIIPVYNGLTYDLPVCLQSIWDQPLDHSLFEVICVDDCSTDDTREWLLKQAEVHKNLRIIFHDVNKRQGGAKNTGFSHAHGKYLMLIDQDDYFHNDGIAKVYDFIKHNDVEILITDSAYQFKDKPHNNLQLNLPNKECLSGEDFVKANGFACAPWRMCINREFYVRHKFSFKENVRIEDLDWSVILYLYAKKIQYVPILLVHYIKAESGTTDNMYRKPEILKDNILAGNRLRDLAYSRFKSSSLQNDVLIMSDTCYNFSCKYMLGLNIGIKAKVDLIKLIDAPSGIQRWVKFAKVNPYIYAMISMLTIPLFRILRKAHRYVTARKFSK